MKLNPKQLQKAMKRFGVQQKDIEATEVIIRTPTEDIHILEPQVALVNMMGQESYQISGQVVKRATEIELSEEDVQTVVDQTGVSREKAIDAIKACNGDLAQAIMDLQ
jgi:nascent polypeptide-associated complex subunit alpha